MLGLVEEDVIKALDADCIGLWGRKNSLGLLNADWKPWALMDGTPVEIAGGFAWDRSANGDVVTYPQGDKNVLPCLKMPKGGAFFDVIQRADQFDEDDLDPVTDFKDQYPVLTDEEALWLESESKKLFEETDYAIIGNFSGGSFGNAGGLGGVGLKSVKGIRRFDDWLAAHILYPDYIHELFDFVLGICLKNLEIYYQAVGSRIDVLMASTTDFGMQTGALISPEQFRTFYKPRLKQFNDWVHKNTKWKVMAHTCGSLADLLDDIAESGIDILNPVQCSARGMDPVMLKEQYGDRFIFWGGGVDTQSTLMYGTVEQVRTEVRQRIDIFDGNGGFVFNPVHNIVDGVPVENILAMYETVNEKRNLLNKWN
jgi:hypothetical protein